MPVERAFLSQIVYDLEHLFCTGRTPVALVMSRNSKECNAMSGNTTKTQSKASAQPRTFNPNEHMRVFERRQRKLDGSYQTVRVDYLDVKRRIVWLRTEHPNDSIETRLLSEPGVSPSVVQATVTLENCATATGFGHCGEDDGSDWLEMAETRAIGRSLALVGCATQFCEDFDEVFCVSPF